MSETTGKPMVSLVVAMDEQRVIGHHNRLPWHLPADLRHFKTLTLGKVVVMGRKTFESIGRPLPGRTNVVVTRARDYHPPECRVVRSLEEALSLGDDHGEIMIIGGATLYECSLPLARRIYLTRIAHTFTGDAYFPPLDPAQWRERERRDFQPDSRNPYTYSFIVLERSAG